MPENEKTDSPDTSNQLPSTKEIASSPDTSNQLPSTKEIASSPDTSNQFPSTKEIASKPLFLRIILYTLKLFWRGIRQTPKIYQGLTTTSSSFGKFIETHRIVIRKIIFVCILIILCIGGYFGYEYQQKLYHTRQVQGQILTAEAWLIHAQYEKAQPIYEELLDKNLSADTHNFLITRIDLIRNLLGLKTAVDKGDLTQVEELLTQSFPNWQDSHKELFIIHSQNFAGPISKLRQYQKNASEILVKLKEGKLEEAESLLQYNLAFTKNAERAFLPLKLEIQKGITEGFPAMLLMAWKYRSSLQLELSDFRTSLGKTTEEQIANAEKMLTNYQTEVAQILAQILTTQDSQILAKRYLANSPVEMDETQLRRLEIALCLDPFLDQAYSQRAVWYRHHKQYTQALKNYSMANNIYTANTLVQKGWCYNEQRNWVQASEAWNQAIESVPECSEARIALAQLAWILQNNVVAQQHISALSNQNLNIPAQCIQSWLNSTPNIDLAKQIFNTNPCVQGYWQLGLAIALDQNQQTQQSLELSKNAYNLLATAEFPAWEVLLYQAIWAEKIGDNATAKTAIEALSSATDPQGKICYAMYCQAKKLPPVEINNLPTDWQAFWQKNNLSQFGSQIK